MKHSVLAWIINARLDMSKKVKRKEYPFKVITYTIKTDPLVKLEDQLTPIVNDLIESLNNVMLIRDYILHIETSRNKKLTRLIILFKDQDKAFKFKLSWPNKI